MSQSKEQLQNKEKDYQKLEEEMTQVSPYSVAWLAILYTGQVQNELKEKDNCVTLLGQQLEQTQTEKTELVCTHVVITCCYHALRRLSVHGPLHHKSFYNYRAHNCQTPYEMLNKLRSKLNN